MDFDTPIGIATSASDAPAFSRMRRALPVRARARTRVRVTRSFESMSLRAYRYGNVKALVSAISLSRKPIGRRNDYGNEY